MVPSTLLGLALFVVLLAPGLAYVLRHERVVPDPEQSAFRETLRVVFTSVACLTVSGLVFTALRGILPGRTLDIGELVQDPGGFTRGHHVEVAWWSLAFVGFATALGALAADPRLIRRVRKVHAGRWARWLFGQGHIGDFSAWREAITELRDQAKRQRGSEPEQETYIGAQMDDGTYICGYLVSYSPRTTEDEHREMILTRAQVRGTNGKVHPVGSTLTVISARQIVRLDVTHLATPRAEPASDPPASNADETVAVPAQQKSDHAAQVQR